MWLSVQQTQRVSALCVRFFAGSSTAAAGGDGGTVHKVTGHVYITHLRTFLMRLRSRTFALRSILLPSGVIQVDLCAEGGEESTGRSASVGQMVGVRISGRNHFSPPPSPPDTQRCVYQAGLNK